MCTAALQCGRVQLASEPSGRLRGPASSFSKLSTPPSIVHSRSSHSLPPATGVTPRVQKRVVAAVIERDDALLICQRPEDKNHGGLWEFPGGKIDSGESIQEAVIRELAEELAVVATNVGDVAFSVSDELSGFEILFVPTHICGEPVALEHTAITWCARNDLLIYALAPSDQQFAKFILGQT